MTQDQLRQSQQASIRQGNLGEQFALSFERKRLPEFLHGQIVHFKEHEIALGYDILSFETLPPLGAVHGSAASILPRSLGAVHGSAASML